MIKNLRYIVLFGLLSCGGEVIQEVPSDIILKEDLIPLIVDLQVLESHFQRQFSRSDLYREALDSSSVSVFESHHVSKQDFSKSMSYYAQKPDSLFVIYEAALDTVNLRLSRLK